MNAYQLELFHHVAKHGGISAAVRHIPGGIGQPAVSGQMRALEEDIGVKLFERSPFRLTAAGEKLCAHVEPFFGGLDEVAARIARAGAPRLRIGASEVIIREHMGAVMDRLREVHPRLQLALRSGFTSELSAWLQEGKIDLAIAPIEDRLPARLRCEMVLRMPLVLLVPRASKWRSAEELWAQKNISEPLVTIPPTESITRLFARGLQRRRVVWPPTIEASSLELVARYVGHGYGLGLNVPLPEFLRHPGLRVLPLEGFDPLEVGIFWQGEPTEVVRTILEESHRYAREVWPEGAVRPEPKTKKRARSG